MIKDEIKENENQLDDQINSELADLFEEDSLKI